MGHRRPQARRCDPAATASVVQHSDDPRRPLVLRSAEAQLLDELGVGGEAGDRDGARVGDVGDQRPEGHDHLDLEPLGRLNDELGEAPPSQARLGPAEQQQVPLGGRRWCRDEGVRRPLDPPCLAGGQADRRARVLKVEELLGVDPRDDLRLERHGDGLERRGRGARRVVPAEERGDQRRGTEVGRVAFPDQWISIHRTRLTGGLCVRASLQHRGHGSRERPSDGDQRVASQSDASRPMLDAKTPPRWPSCGPGSASRGGTRACARTGSRRETARPTSRSSCAIAPARSRRACSARWTGSRRASSRAMRSGFAVARSASAAISMRSSRTSAASKPGNTRRPSSFPPPTAPSRSSRASSSTSRARSTIRELRAVVEEVLFRDPVAREFRRAPCTRAGHHAYLGGLRRAHGLGRDHGARAVPAPSPAGLRSADGRRAAARRRQGARVHLRRRVRPHGGRANARPPRDRGGDHRRRGGRAVRANGGSRCCTACSPTTAPIPGVRAGPARVPAASARRRRSHCIASTPSTPRSKARWSTASPDSGGRRSRLRCERARLSASRRSLAAREGRVGRRLRGVASAVASRSRNRSRASSLLRACPRASWATAVTRASGALDHPSLLLLGERAGRRDVEARLDPRRGDVRVLAAWDPTSGWPGARSPTAAPRHPVSRPLDPPRSAILGPVPGGPAKPAEVVDLLRPLRADPESSAIFCDIDGTLAPIAERSDKASVPDDDTGRSRVARPALRRGRLRVGSEG